MLFVFYSRQQETRLNSVRFRECPFKSIGREDFIVRGHSVSISRNLKEDYFGGGCLREFPSKTLTEICCLEQVSL